MKNSFISFCLSAVLGLALPAASQKYKVIDLGTLPGGSLSNAFGVNDQGQVVLQVKARLRSRTDAPIALVVKGQAEQ